VGHHEERVVASSTPSTVATLEDERLRRRRWTDDVAWIKESREKLRLPGDKQRQHIGGAKDHLYQGLLDGLLASRLHS
jgi:hypothetical protein